MVLYSHTLEGISAAQLSGGFFEGWPDPPSPETHLRILGGSGEVILAVDEESDAVVGFTAAVTDGVLCAHITLLEVLPKYRGRDVGRGLVERMLGRMERLYAVDVTCEPDLRPFYASLGLRPTAGMVLRRYANQSGLPPGGSGEDTVY
ncbi:MAG: GNAT family N-acetyltransferase [Rubrobacter sp.]|nr:GNAT family N-acetyltransferase [Rubrobacter sp.]